MKEVKKKKKVKEVKNNKKSKKKTDNIKNDKIVKCFILIAYIFILCLAWYDFWNVKSGDEIGFTLLYFYILLPVITLIVSIYVGKENIKNVYKILLILLFSILYMSPTFVLVIKGDFSLIDLIEAYYDLIFNGLIVSLVGLFIGMLIKTRKDKCKKK